MPISTTDGHWSLALVTPPTTELITVAEAKTFCRVDDDLTAEDDFLADEIAAARQRFERVTGRAQLTATYRYCLDRWPCGGVLVPPLTPLAAVTTLKYVATDGTLTTLSSSAYDVDVYSSPGRITPVYATCWPDIRCTPNAVQLTFTAGVAAASSIPDAAEIRNRMRACVAYCYANREQRDEGKLDGLFASLWNGVL